MLFHWVDAAGIRIAAYLFTCVSVLLPVTRAAIASVSFVREAASCTIDLRVPAIAYVQDLRLQARLQ